ncbi:hypothetical protein SHKM778_02280 [Streptomyces sp. KM77-8]|uniref:Uncharacterized protein n=1 Tax=Streptomyces haneummycinicus TaxID=3074435 RepID=A0AAT9H8T1_9ACTN
MGIGIVLVVVFGVLVTVVMVAARGGARRVGAGRAGRRGRGGRDSWWTGGSHGGSGERPAVVVRPTEAARPAEAGRPAGAAADAVEGRLTRGSRLRIGG